MKPERRKETERLLLAAWKLRCGRWDEGEYQAELSHAFRAAGVKADTDIAALLASEPTQTDTKTALKIMAQFKPHFDGTAKDDSDARYEMTKATAAALASARAADRARVRELEAALKALGDYWADWLNASDDGCGMPEETRVKEMVKRALGGSK